MKKALCKIAVEINGLRFRQALNTAKDRVNEICGTGSEARILRSEATGHTLFLFGTGGRETFKTLGWIDIRLEDEPAPRRQS